MQEDKIIMRLLLNGTWTMTRSSDSAEFPAAVPGTDFGALIKCGEIGNPLVSRDEKEALATASDSYSFSRQFDINADMLGNEFAFLKCDSVDTLCDVFINGNYVISLDNAFIPLDTDIKRFLCIGKNSIEFRFSSPYLYIKDRYKNNPLIPNPNGVNGIPYIRKPGCHFGWDWGPCVPYCGILSDICIDFTDRRISGIRIKQNTCRYHSVVTVTAEGADAISMYSPDGERIIGKNGRFEIENPDLWYPRDLRQREIQPLYKIVISNSGETIEKRIGLRSVVLDRNHDEYGNDFCFVVNGERVFAKGANLIPFSALFEDRDESTADYYLGLAVKSGFNMLRVWGGGSYASDYLLDRCDELGILVWQDFCFACQLYPFYENDFLENVLEEIKSNVERMDSHPCLAIFCGNNEAESMFSYLPKKSRLVSSYIDFFYGRLQKLVPVLTDIPYIPSSPAGDAPFRNNGSDNTGDTHMWHVWHGLKKLDYYQKRYTRFMSEFGLESLPSIKAVSTFADEKDYSLSSPPFLRHQKCKGGNEKMLYYLTEMFDFSENFKDLPFLTGIVQAECVKNAAIHFRQNKGRCNGCLFWQFNDVWNCPSWSAVDFEGVPKALAYRCREFFAPVLLSVKRNDKDIILYSHNDTLEDISFEALIEFYNFDGDVTRSETKTVKASAGSVEKVCVLPYRKGDVLRIRYRGNEIVEIFDKPYRMKLSEAEIKAVHEDNDLILSTDSFAYNVCVECDAVPDSNYFSLFKDEKKRITFDSDPGNIRIMCVNNTEFIASPLKRRLFRLKYRLKPANIVNSIVYSFT